MWRSPFFLSDLPRANSLACIFASHRRVSSPFVDCRRRSTNEPYISRQATRMLIHITGDACNVAFAGNWQAFVEVDVPGHCRRSFCSSTKLDRSVGCTPQEMIVQYIMPQNMRLDWGDIVPTRAVTQFTAVRSTHCPGLQVRRAYRRNCKLKGLQPGREPHDTAEDGRTARPPCSKCYPELNVFYNLSLPTTMETSLACLDPSLAATMTATSQSGSHDLLTLIHQIMLLSFTEPCSSQSRRGCSRGRLWTHCGGLPAWRVMPRHGIRPLPRPRPPGVIVVVALVRVALPLPLLQLRVLHQQAQLHNTALRLGPSTALLRDQEPPKHLKIGSDIQVTGSAHLPSHTSAMSCCHSTTAAEACEASPTGHAPSTRSIATEACAQHSRTQHSRPKRTACPLPPSMLIRCGDQSASSKMPALNTGQKKHT